MNIDTVVPIITTPARVSMPRSSCRLLMLIKIGGRMPSAICPHMKVV
ncbi:MAG: hypothetical protein R2709_11120 [Marmoricola sp.]